MKYLIGLRGHDIISPSREVTYEGRLSTAKRIATRKFGQGFSHHTIVIVDEEGDLVASRQMNDRYWINHKFRDVPLADVMQQKENHDND